MSSAVTRSGKKRRRARPGPAWTAGEDWPGFGRGRGGTRQSLRVWARGVANARIRRLEQELGRLERLPDADTIHDVRVAGRRLRAALRHLEPCFRAHEAERLRLAVRRLARMLGELRDLDILVESLAADAARPRSPLAMLVERLKARRQKRLARALPEARLLRRRLPGWLRRLPT